MWTVEEVAKQLRVHEITVRRWLRAGTLEGFRAGGTKAGWRIPDSAIQQFIEKHRPKGKP